MLFRVRLRLGHFDPPGPLQQIKRDVICSEETLAISRAGSVQGSVLLKNLHHTLPLDKQRTGSIAVIGPNSNLSKKIAGYYGGKQPCGGHFYNMVDAVAQHARPATPPSPPHPTLDTILSQFS